VADAVFGQSPLPASVGLAAAVMKSLEHALFPEH
jgi:hypothetical protein